MRRYKNWAHKIGSWKYLTIWRPVLPVFPRARSASFLLSTWTPFRGCWKSAAAAAHDLILVEVDGKCQWQMPIRSWQGFLKGGRVSACFQSCLLWSSLNERESERESEGVRHPSMQADSSHNLTPQPLKQWDLGGVKGAPKSHHQPGWLSQPHLQPPLLHLLKTGHISETQADRPKDRPRSSRASSGRRLPPGPSQPGPVPRRTLTHPCVHTIALNAGSSVDTSQWYLAQRACSGNVPAAELTASQEKALSFFSMDMGQVFKFWVPSLNDKSRSCLWKTLEFIRFSFVDHGGRAWLGSPLSFYPHSDWRLCLNAKGLIPLSSLLFQLQEAQTCVDFPLYQILCDLFIADSEHMGMGAGAYNCVPL